MHSLIDRYFSPILELTDVISPSDFPPITTGSAATTKKHIRVYSVSLGFRYACYVPLCTKTSPGFPNRTSPLSTSFSIVPEITIL